MKKVTVVLAIALVAVIAIALQAYAASDTVNVTGRTSAKIVMSIDDTTMAFGTFEPDVPQTGQNFNVEVKSNKGYNYYMTAPWAFSNGSAPTIDHLEYNRAGWANFAAGNNDPLAGLKTASTIYAYQLRLTFGYDEDPDVDYTADIVPTALQ